MKAVQLLVNSYFPKELRNYTGTFDKQDVNKRLYALGQRFPDKFGEVVKQLSDVGRKASYLQGESITLQDLAPVMDKKPLFKMMTDEIKALPKDRNFDQNKAAIQQKYNTMLEKELGRNALRNRNNIAMAVLSGARGKNAQLKAMIGTPWQFSDYKGRPIDVISKESYAEGVRPYVYLASTYGSRSSVISTKSSTAKGGDWSKQMAQTAADMVVRKENCGTGNGIALDIDDKSLKGRALAKDVGDFKAGTFITADMLTTLRKKGVKGVVVRSPMTCQVHDGFCAHCIGKFYNGGKLPKVGDAIGALAATTVGEPVTQMALNAKHQNGMTSASKTYAGLPILQQFTQSPEKFQHRAAVAELDGKVDAVEDASQGGKYVIIGGQKHYVPAGHEVEVKPGDVVEAGDFLSEGLGDAEDVIRLKGLGAGRKYYASRLNQILADSGAKTDARNTEILARAAIRHVRVTSDEGLGDYLPDDVVDYNAIQASYRMPTTTKVTRPRDAVGKYLQAPALHYTIGTRITPKVAKDLEDNSYDGIYSDDTKPDFEPEMIRLRASSHTTKDWIAAQGTSYLSKQLNESTVRGEDSNVLDNPDYRPRLAYGAGFAENVETTGRF